MPMPGWRDLQRMLDAAREERDSPAQPVRSEQVQLREGLIHFFQPVYELMDRLHDAGIRLHGAAAIPRLIKRGTAAKAELAPNAGPNYCVQLDSTSHLIITVATRRGLRYPEIILQAKWRARVTTNGEDSETKLTDSFDDLARWIVGIITQYEVTTDDPPPLEVLGTAEHHEAPTTREHRVIMLDDILNEENQ